LIINVLLARRINHILGGAVIAPWEIDQLPDDTLTSILSIEEIGKVKAGINKVENIFATWRADYARKQH
jgi:hypothetical protein